MGLKWIQWESMRFNENSWDLMGLHGILWDLMRFNWTLWHFMWSNEIEGEFIRFNGASWNCMGFFMAFHVESHDTLVNVYSLRHKTWPFWSWISPNMVVLSPLVDWWDKGRVTPILNRSSSKTRSVMIALW